MTRVTVSYTHLVLSEMSDHWNELNFESTIAKALNYLRDKFKKPGYVLDELRSGLQTSSPTKENKLHIRLSVIQSRKQSPRLTFKLYSTDSRK